MNALLCVDIQNDFLPTGALPVPCGDQVVPIVNRLMPAFDIVVATQDWHPADHLSFASQHPGRGVGEVINLDGLEQVLWPDHCVQNTPGADFAPGLDTSRFDHIVRKATDRRIDSYSAFFDNGHRRSTGLADWLADRRVTTVYLAGLATDYCVKFSALDARRLGLETVVIEDACRGIDRQPGDVARALDEMRAAGARVLSSGEVSSAQ